MSEFDTADIPDSLGNQIPSVSGAVGMCIVTGHTSPSACFRSALMTIP